MGAVTFAQDVTSRAFRNEDKQSNSRIVHSFDMEKYRILASQKHPSPTHQMLLPV
jgi:hypothetical protein